MGKVKTRREQVGQTRSCVIGQERKNECLSSGNKSKRLGLWNQRDTIKDSETGRGEVRCKWSRSEANERGRCALAVCPLKEVLVVR